MDEPLVYQLSCQGHRWVAMFGWDNRWKHLSGKPTLRLIFPEGRLKTTSLIGWMCKYCKVFSWPILIDRLAYYFLRFNYLIKGKSTINNKIFLKRLTSGIYREVAIPSSIPNLEVKHFISDNTYPCGIGKVGRCQSLVFLEIFFYLQIIYSISLYYFITFIFFYACFI